MIVVGIDVSKSTFDVSWQRGEHSSHRSFEYTDAGIGALLEHLPEPAHCVMEATGIYHLRLALALYEAGQTVSVVNPLVIKRFGQMQLSRVKSDKADAELIRCYGVDQCPPAWSPNAGEVVELQQAHRWLDDLIGERTRLTNRVEAQRHHPEPSAFVAEQMSSQLRQLNKQIQACERHLEVMAKKSFPELYKRLLSIPSIGPKSAIELIVITGGFTRFDDVKALGAYIGVSPTTHQSGTSVNAQGAIAKLGQARMRQLLYMCSWTAKRCNPACQALYQRLKAAGKPAKVINIAIAHKLLRQAYAVATTNQPFSAEYA